MKMENRKHKNKEVLMKLIEYDYNDTTELTTHYNVSEWKCKCGRKHKIVIADALPCLLENVMEKIGAVKGYISSGYRCELHEKNIGGTGSDTHQGYACDIKFTDKDGIVIDSKYVALALEDLGHQCGIGYKCGGNNFYTHIDVKPRKWYGDESKSMSKSCCTSFYSYFNIKKETSLTYQSYDLTKKKWLPNVKIGTNDYAGNFGNPISAIYVDELEMQTHDIVKKKWLPWVKGRSDYAGNLNNPIDGVRIKGAIYRVKLKGDKDFLPWVYKADNTNQGYAGIYGREIDAIQIKKEPNFKSL